MFMMCEHIASMVKYIQMLATILQYLNRAYHYINMKNYSVA